MFILTSVAFFSNDQDICYLQITVVTTYLKQTCAHLINYENHTRLYTNREISLYSRMYCNIENWTQCTLWIIHWRSYINVTTICIFPMLTIFWAMFSVCELLQFFMHQIIGILLVLLRIVKAQLISWHAAPHYG